MKNKKYIKKCENINYRDEYNLSWWFKFTTLFSPPRTWESVPKKTKRDVLKCEPPKFTHLGKSYEVFSYDEIVERVK